MDRRAGAAASALRGREQTGQAEEDAPDDLVDAMPGAGAKAGQLQSRAGERPPRSGQELQRDVDEPEHEQLPGDRLGAVDELRQERREQQQGLRVGRDGEELPARADDATGDRG